MHLVPDSNSRFIKNLLVKSAQLRNFMQGTVVESMRAFAKEINDPLSQMFISKQKVFKYVHFHLLYL